MGSYAAGFRPGSVGEAGTRPARHGSPASLPKGRDPRGAVRTQRPKGAFLAYHLSSGAETGLWLGGRNLGSPAGPERALRDRSGDQGSQP